jgi:Ni,Fe-hydrogenase III large subunit/Ni,Fe-hydrogenase III component G
MGTLAHILKKGRKVEHHPHSPRVVLAPKAANETWRALTEQLLEGRLTLFGLWGEPHGVHVALLDEASPEIAVVTLECSDGKFPSIGAKHAPAIRLERALCDLYGLVPVGLSDTRPWLDLGFWGVAHPLGAKRRTRKQASRYAFLPAEGEGLHQIPVGPVHAGIIEPGHFRFTANGETVVRLEERLGYVHKGIEGLMQGASIDQGARLAGRTSGDSTVAYAFAFAQAVETALQVNIPPRATWLRALMAELERLANHLGDIGAICNDASFPLLQADFAVLRERTLRAAHVSFGHRLMMDRVLPGGVAQDVADDGPAQLQSLLEVVRQRLPELVEVYDNTASLQDRTVSTGFLRRELVRAFGAGGYVGRASGRGFDTRKVFAYAPYDQIDFEVPVLVEGDVNARVWIRIREIEQSLKLIEQILAKLPKGGVHTELPHGGKICEGLGLVEGFRGDVLVWIRLSADGHIARCHLRDPSWFQWPLLETAIEDNIVADFPLCNKSFNCSYSGHDL